MQAGKLRSRVLLQRPGPGRDELNQRDPASWSDVTKLWANIAHKSGLESIKGDAAASVVQASVRIRYRTGIDASMRIVHGTTIYDIRAVLPDEGKREFTDLVCETGAKRL